MVRGLDTTVRKLRRKVFEEVARLGFRANEENFAETLNDEVEAIPYRMVNDEKRYRESVYRARAVLSERLRLAMGLSLRPEDKPVHLTAGMEASNISDKYYEPPLMQVIPSACAACSPNTASYHLHFTSALSRNCVTDDGDLSCFQPFSGASLLNCSHIWRFVYLGVKEDFSAIRRSPASSVIFTVLVLQSFPLIRHL